MRKYTPTPGPWDLRISDNGTPYVTHGGWAEDGIDDLSRRVCVMPAEITQSFNSYANARLISAAPELLEALQSIVRSLSDQDDEGLIEHAEPMINARAAIAKALGTTEATR